MLSTTGVFIVFHSFQYIASVDTFLEICRIDYHDVGHDGLLQRQLGSRMPDASCEWSISSHGFGEVDSGTGLASAASSGFAHCRPLPSSAEPLHEIHNGSHRYNFAKIAYGSEAAASTCRAIGQKVITFMIVPFVMTLLALGVNINYICRNSCVHFYVIFIWSYVNMSMISWQSLPLLRIVY